MKYLVKVPRCVQGVNLKSLNDWVSIDKATWKGVLRLDCASKWTADPCMGHGKYLDTLSLILSWLWDR